MMAGRSKDWGAADVSVPPEPTWDYQQQVLAEDRLREAIHNAYIDVTRTSAERMLQRADSVLRVAAAIGTVFTTVLGLLVAVDGRRISAWAFLPTSLIAASMVLAAFYLGYVSTRSEVAQPLKSSLSAQVQHARLAEYVSWVNRLALRRVWALRLAILTLGVAVASMPIAYVTEHQCVYGVGIAAVLAACVVADVLINRKQ